jgi:hypothetical protein
MWSFFSRILGKPRIPKGWDLVVKRLGRGGPVSYVEGTNRIEFDFELGNQEVGGFIFCPGSADWDSRYPWAAGRRSAIVDRVVAEFTRREFRGYAFGPSDGRDDVFVIRRGC